MNSIPGTTCTEMMYADKQEGKLDCWSFLCKLCIYIKWQSYLEMNSI